MLFESNRLFEVWQYDTNRQTLHIRSTKTAEESTNLDVIFVGVVFIQLPTILDGLAIRKASVTESQAVDELRGKKSEQWDVTYCLNTLGIRKAFVGMRETRNFVVGCWLNVFQNSLEYHEAILTYMDGTGLKPEMGTVLYDSELDR